MESRRVTEVYVINLQFICAEDEFLERMVPDFSALDFVFLGQETGVRVRDLDLPG